MTIAVEDGLTTSTLARFPLTSRRRMVQITRAIGDMYLKHREFNGPPLPPFFQIKDDFNPPYISNEPEVSA